MATVNVIILVNEIDRNSRPIIRCMTGQTLRVQRNNCQYELNIISVGNSNKVNIGYNNGRINLNNVEFSASKFFILISHYRMQNNHICSVRINNKEINEVNDFQNDYVSTQWVQPISSAKVYFCSISGLLIERIITAFNNNNSNLNTFIQMIDSI